MASSALDNPKWEAFAQAVAFGSSATAAWRDCVSQGECTTKSAMEQGSRLMSDVNVSSRVADLRMSFKEVLESKLGVKQETLARHLLSIIETPVGEVSQDSPLCQEYARSRKIVGKGEEAEEWETEKVKTPSKLDAIKELNKMAGYYAPEQVESKMEVVIRKL